MICKRALPQRPVTLNNRDGNSDSFAINSEAGFKMDLEQKEAVIDERQVNELTIFDCHIPCLLRTYTV